MKLIIKLMVLIMLTLIVIVLILSYWAYLSDYAANKEALLDKNLLIATNDELDVREALVRQNFADKDKEWKLAYQKPVVPLFGYTT